jgi:hypothetical protein
MIMGFVGHDQIPLVGTLCKSTEVAIKGAFDPLNSGVNSFRCTAVEGVFLGKVGLISATSSAVKVDLVYTGFVVFISVKPSPYRDCLSSWTTPPLIKLLYEIVDVIQEIRLLKDPDVWSSHQGFP